MKVLAILVSLFFISNLNSQIFIEPEVFLPYGLPYELKGYSNLIPHVTDKRTSLLSAGAELEIGYKYKKNSVKIGYQRTYLRNKQCFGPCQRKTRHLASGIGADTITFDFHASRSQFISLNTLNRIPISYSRLFQVKKTDYQWTLGTSIPLGNRYLKDNAYNEHNPSEKTQHKIDQGISFFAGIEQLIRNKSKTLECFLGIQGEYISDINQYHYGRTSVEFEPERVYVKAKFGIRVYLMNEKKNADQ